MGLRRSHLSRDSPLLFSKTTIDIAIECSATSHRLIAETKKKIYIYRTLNQIIILRYEGTAKSRFPVALTGQRKSNSEPKSFASLSKKRSPFEQEHERRLDHSLCFTYRIHAHASIHAQNTQRVFCFLFFSFLYVITFSIDHAKNNLCLKGHHKSLSQQLLTVKIVRLA